MAEKAIKKDAASIWARVLVYIRKDVFLRFYYLVEAFVVISGLVNFTRSFNENLSLEFVFN